MWFLKIVKFFVALQMCKFQAMAFIWMPLNSGSAMGDGSVACYAKLVVVDTNTGCWKIVFHTKLLERIISVCLGVVPGISEVFNSKPCFVLQILVAFAATVQSLHTPASIHNLDFSCTFCSYMLCIYYKWCWIFWLSCYHFLLYVLELQGPNLSLETDCCDLCFFVIFITPTCPR
jgi:hypothetical protein